MNPFDTAACGMTHAGKEGTNGLYESKDIHPIYRALRSLPTHSGKNIRNPAAPIPWLSTTWSGTIFTKGGVKKRNFMEGVIQPVH